MVEGLSAALGRLYAWVLKLAGHRHAAPALAAVAFAESSFFPVPPDAMIVPMVLARRERWIRIALIALAGSVAGGFLGYAIGYLLWDAIGEAILGFYRLGDAFAEFQDWYADGGALIVFFAAFTPLPYKAITIARRSGGHGSLGVRAGIDQRAAGCGFSWSQLCRRCSGRRPRP